MATSSSALVTLGDLKLFAGITSSQDDRVLEMCIDRATGIIEQYCGREFKAKRRYEWIDTSGQKRVPLRQSPVTAIRFVGVGLKNAMSIQSTIASDVVRTVTVSEDSLTLYRVDSTGAAVETSIPFSTYETTAEVSAQVQATTGFSSASLDDFPSRYLRRISGRDLRDHVLYVDAASESFDDYECDRDSGIIFGSTLNRYRGLFVDYTAGYSTIPYDVHGAAMTIALRYYRERQQDPNLQSESLGGYTYSRRSVAEMKEQLAEMLGNWRRIR